MTSVIDHLVYVFPNLDDGIRQTAALLGVTPAVGGRHPKLGTQNALLSLGPQVYLEIMTPDESPADPRRPRPFGLDHAMEPRLVTWVARSADLRNTVSVARREGVDLGEILAGSRQRPDGSTLKWEMTDLTADREGGIIPYFINWASSAHPAGSAPAGCTLVELTLSHPDEKRIARVLQKLGIDSAVTKGPAALEAVIDSPRGRIVLR